jgi:Flp pilus assembly protein TadD
MGLLQRLIAGALGFAGKSDARSIAKSDSANANVETHSAADQFADIYALMDAGRYEEALAACVAAPLLADTAPWIPLAEGMLQAGHPDLARRLLAHLNTLYSEDAALHERLALVALAQADFAGAKAAAERAAALDPARPWPRVVLAESALREERFDEAETGYRALADAGSEWLMCRTVYFSRAFFDRLQEQDDDLPPPQTIVAATSDDFDYVVLVSCDSKYFAEYAGAFVNAYARNGGARGLLHLHVVDPPAGFAVIVDRLIAKTGIEKIAVTCEANPFPDLSQLKQKVFYTCARFLHFGTWLQAYRKPIVCFDVDAIIEKPLTPLLEACRHADLGLVRREPRRAIWLDIVGYTVVGQPTPASAAYFRLLRRFLTYFARNSLLYWQVDQIGLNCVLIMQQRFGLAPAVRDIYGTIDDVAWLLARRREGGKTGDPVYLGYQIDI